MIVVDTSALIAVVLNEPEADRCATILEEADHSLICAVTVAETLIVAAARNAGGAVRHLMTGLHMDVVPVSQITAERAAQAYAVWGKGRHPAGLNFGDCFAYALAQERGYPLLFVGEDFARTDIVAASLNNIHS